MSHHDKREADVAISSRSVVMAAESQTSCELHAETVILDFNKGAYFGLDEIGTLIWQQLQQPLTVEAVCDAVVEQYDVDRTTGEQDVIRLLEMLQAEGLIEVRSGPPT